MVVGFCGVLLFLFVPESFWDRTPTKAHHSSDAHHPSKTHHSSKTHPGHSLFVTPSRRPTSKSRVVGPADSAVDKEKAAAMSDTNESSPGMPALTHHHTSPRHVDFAPVVPNTTLENTQGESKVGRADALGSGSPLASTGISPLDNKSLGIFTHKWLKSS